MLPRSKRLTSRHIDLIMKKGRVTHSSLFILRAMPADGGSRFAAIVPNRVGKTSVARHTLRRKMYESIAPLLSNLENNVHGAVFAKVQAQNADFKMISSDMNNLFVKAGLLK